MHDHRRRTWREEILGDGQVRLICGDCREVLPTLGKVDACVTDPPYGIGEAAGKNASRSKPMRGHELKMPGKTKRGMTHRLIRGCSPLRSKQEAML